jgi:hypothetical protein
MQSDGRLQQPSPDRGLNEAEATTLRRIGAAH